ncbi:MAG: hypothetical protein ACLSFA_05455 [Roseburia inulinivorans]
MYQELHTKKKAVKYLPEPIEIVDDNIFTHMVQSLTLCDSMECEYIEKVYKNVWKKLNRLNYFGNNFVTSFLTIQNVHVKMALTRGYKGGEKIPFTTKLKHSISGIYKTLKSFEIPLMFCPFL